MDNNNSGFGGGNGTGSDQPGQTPAAPAMGGVIGVQTPPVVEPTVPVSMPPVGGSDPAGIGTPPITTPVDTAGMGTGAPVTPAPAVENPEQSGGGTGGTTTGM